MKYGKQVAIIALLIIRLVTICGLDAVVIEQDEEMVELRTWFFTSGVLNNEIRVKHSDENAKFELSVDKGGFALNDKSVTLDNGESAYWHGFEMPTDEKVVKLAYVDIIVKVDDNIVGYAVVKITRKSENSAAHNAEILKSVSFPKIGDEYQNITYEQVAELIQAAKG